MSVSPKIIGKQVKYGLLKQTNWTTPIGASGNFLELNYDKDKSIPNPDNQVEDMNAAGQYGIHKEYERFFIDKTSGLPSLNFEAIVTKNLLAYHLAAALQAVSEAGSGAYKKTITCGGLTGPINFNAGAGTTGGPYVFSLAIENNVSTRSGIIIQNAILDQFNISCDFNARGFARLFMMKGTWKGNNYVPSETFSGTWVAQPTLAAFNNSDTFTPSTFTINSVDFSAEVIRKFEVDIKNAVTSNAKTTGGKANQYDTTPVYTFKLLLDYNAITYPILASFGNGDDVVLTFKNGVTTGSDGELNFAVSKGKLTTNPYVWNGNFLGVEVTFEAKAVAGATPLTILLTDNQNTGL